MSLRATVAVSALSLALGGFVTTVMDPDGAWWFERDGTRFLSLAMNHVNDGGQGELRARP